MWHCITDGTKIKMSLEVMGLCLTVIQETVLVVAKVENHNLSG